MESSSRRNNYYLSNKDNFKVVIRVRPPITRELKKFGAQYRNNIEVEGNKTVTIYELVYTDVDQEGEEPQIYSKTTFTYDHVHDPQSTQREVYEVSGRNAVESILNGYNATVIAYGQTGSGKTHTLDGFYYEPDNQNKGLISRCLEEVFNYIELSSTNNYNYLVRASFLQIYNETISDLLRPNNSKLDIREDKKYGVKVDNLSEWAVRTPSEIYSLMQAGSNNRTTACTKMNDVSSRSHAIFIITVEQSYVSFYTNDDIQITYDDYEHLKNQGKDQECYYCHKYRVGKLNLVDLAGSERVSITGAVGTRLEESKYINKSLSALGNVIAALTDKNTRSHIPYRDSFITRILFDSLGGNCKTTFMGMVTPSPDSYGESLSTLKFASRAKNIKNDARINEDINQSALLRQYQNEIENLKKELEKTGKDDKVYDMLNSLEEEKKKALEDKELAIRLLEQRSKEYEIYEQEHDRLTEKLQYLESKLLIGGRKIEETPQFKVILEEKSKLIQMEYENKMLELDKEKRSIEEEKLLVERYKQLLLKQRDIMIALTSRLNERDETILSLQEEADHSQKQISELEQNNNGLVGRVAYLEARLQENGVEFESGHEGRKAGAQDKELTNQIENLKEQLEERNKGESICLKELLSTVKNFTETNDRHSFLDSIDRISRKFNLEGKLGNVKQLKEINNTNTNTNTNIHKSLDQMINDRMKQKNYK